LLKYLNGGFSYISIQHGCFIGQIFQSKYLPLRFINFFLPGLVLPLKYLTIQHIFSNIFLYKSKKKKYALSAGTYCRLVQVDNEKQIISVRLPTLQIKQFNFNTFVTMGRNSNIFLNKQVIGKSGLNRLNGIRPTTRGVAMNPVDHPHGGRTKTNRPEVSPWG